MRSPQYRNHRRGCECEKRYNQRVALGRLYDKFKSDSVRLRLEDMQIEHGNLERACVRPGCFI